MKKKLIISTLCILLSGTVTSAGVRTIELPPEISGSTPMKCGDYIYFGEKRSPYDVCMITGLLKEYERGQCISRNDYKLLHKSCSTKPDNISQAYKMRDSSYYVESSPENGDGFVDGD
ncbi:hypothetical protein [Gallibacterium anatis]|uniref:Uncharacterized protein n=1 Tax=Gallibacterium anatis TaxID=750 RepID=A0A0A2XI03_9PAST|nr:hypothetical protein [Gallibacterium anatis]KGQ32001.1 hypothetical protein JP32_05775 [Gallibacterium anatis]